MKFLAVAFALVILPSAALAQSSASSTTTTINDGKYQPGTLGSGTADAAGQAMQGAINTADNVGDGITPASSDPTSKDPKEPKGKDPKDPRPAPTPKEPKDPKVPKVKGGDS